MWPGMNRFISSRAIWHPISSAQFLLHKRFQWKSSETRDQNQVNLEDMRDHLPLMISTSYIFMPCNDNSHESWEPFSQGVQIDILASNGSAPWLKVALRKHVFMPGRFLFWNFALWPIYYFVAYMWTDFDRSLTMIDHCCADSQNTNERIFC